VARFRVAFDGEWQEDFDTLADAVEWAQEVSLTGRTTYVVERRAHVHRVRAAFPEERAKEAKRAWRAWNWAAWGSG